MPRLSVFVSHITEERELADFLKERLSKDFLRWVDVIVGDAPIVYSLLGNTVANFQHDDQLLKTVAGLLRPQDRLLLEVATAERVDAVSARLAADEYANSTAFKQFVTSALLQYTDLPAGDETVEFVGQPEDERTILVKAIYRNGSGQSIPMKLPDNTTIEFRADDTIRLLISRKYTEPGISALLCSAGLAAVHRVQTSQSRAGFGIQLILAASEPIVRPADQRRVSRCSMRGRAARSTSPTTCRLRALTLSNVSSGVCHCG